MIDSLRRAIYHTLKAAWYRAFGEPLPHVHLFSSCWTGPYELLSRCACGEIGPHICLAASGVCIWCDPRIIFKTETRELPKPIIRVAARFVAGDNVFATRRDE